MAVRRNQTGAIVISAKAGGD